MCVVWKLLTFLVYLGFPAAISCREEASLPRRSDNSTQIGILPENRHRKFLKLACKTEKGLEWVKATTTVTGLSIGLVVDDQNHDQEESLERDTTTDDLLNQNEREWLESGGGESRPAREEDGPARQEDIPARQEDIPGPAIKEENEDDELFRFIFSMPTAPLNGVFRLKEWYTGRFKYVDKNSSKVKTILDIIKLKYCELSIEEIHDHIMSCDQMYYAAIFGNFSEYYYSIEQSIDELENVLLYQFGNNKDSVKSFLKNLYDVLNKNIPNVNAFYVDGNDKGDKRFFFDAVVHYFVNFGQMGNFNAYSPFPFQDCINRRILLWNDPNVEPSAMGTVGLLFAGEAINVKTNYLDDYTLIGRTPIIVLTSQSQFSQIRSSIHSYHWSGSYSSSLKDFKKKPLPIAIYHLFKRYNIILNIDTVPSNNETTVDSE